ncbi:hypothetical protein RCL1_005260 [Eukaryota sp. TZLM3-RCL]
MKLLRQNTLVYSQDSVLSCITCDLSADSVSSWSFSTSISLPLFYYQPYSSSQVLLWDTSSVYSLSITSDHSFSDLTCLGSLTSDDNFIRSLLVLGSQSPTAYILYIDYKGLHVSPLGSKIGPTPAKLLFKDFSRLLPCTLPGLFCFLARNNGAVNLISLIPSNFSIDITSSVLNLSWKFGSSDLIETIKVHEVSYFIVLCKAKLVLSLYSFDLGNICTNISEYVSNESFRSYFDSAIKFEIFNNSVFLISTSGILKFSIQNLEISSPSIIFDGFVDNACLLTTNHVTAIVIMSGSLLFFSLIEYGQELSVSQRLSNLSSTVDSINSQIRQSIQSDSDPQLIINNYLQLISTKILTPIRSLGSSVEVLRSQCNSSVTDIESSTADVRLKVENLTKSNRKIVELIRKIESNHSKIQSKLNVIMSGLVSSSVADVDIINEIQSKMTLPQSNFDLFTRDVTAFEATLNSLSRVKNNLSESLSSISLLTSDFKNLKIKNID